MSSAMALLSTPSNAILNYQALNKNDMVHELWCSRPVQDYIDSLVLLYASQHIVKHIEKKNQFRKINT